MSTILFILPLSVRVQDQGRSRGNGLIRNCALQSVVADEETAEFGACLVCRENKIRS